MVQGGSNQPAQHESSPVKESFHSNKSEPYDGDKIPPNFDIARKHGKAFRVYKHVKEEQHDHENDEFEDKCPCCLLRVEGEKLPITCDISEIYHLGSGYALYFSFLKYAIGLLVVGFVVSGIFNLSTNLAGHDCTHSNSNDPVFCASGLLIDMSLANKRDDDKTLTSQIAINLALVIVVALVFHVIRYRLRKRSIDADDGSVTPADYTVFVTGLPKDVTEQEIKEYIEGLGGSEMTIKCEKIIRPENIEGYAAQEYKKDQYLKEIKSSYDENRKIMLERDLEDLTMAWKSKLDAREEIYTNKAFVVLTHAKMADFINNKFRKSRAVRFIQAANPTIDAYNYLKGQKLKICRAPEPSDVLWENLGYNNSQRLKYKAVTSAATLFILILSFFAILGLYWVQETASDNQASHLIMTVIYYGISVLLCVINTILSTVIRVLAGYEKADTKTGFLTAIARKQSVALLINTAFTSLLVQIALGARGSTFIGSIQALNIYGQKGLIESMFSVFVINAIYTPIYNIFDPFYFQSLVKQKMAALRGEDAILTQDEANVLFQGPQSDLSLKYSALIKTVLLACFYAPAMPIAVIITIAGLVLSYWVDKYILLRRNALPTSVGDELSDSMIEYLEWMSFTFSAGNMFFLVTLVNSNGDRPGGPLYTFLLWLTFGLSMIHILLPMDMINEALFKIKNEVTEFQSFSEVRDTFETDYDLQNPVTREKAARDMLSSAKERHNSSFHRIKKMLTTNKDFNDNLQQMIHNMITEDDGTSNKEKVGSTNLDQSNQPEN